jgi:pSer/pThr/pTyr-binding forkhead associated (FHA) protein
MKVALVVRSMMTAERLPITADSVLLGRNEDNDVVLDDPRVSRYHARIVWTGKDYRIEDVASTNGTWLNGERVTGPMLLKDGDLIQLGDVTLEFEVQGRETMTMPAGPPKPDGLTRREAEVLTLLAQGKSNNEIASELVLSVRTVERHLTNVYAKTGTRNRSEATSYALSHGLMTRVSAARTLSNGNAD